MEQYTPGHLVRCRHVIGSGVHLGDDDITFVFQIRGNLIVDWRQVLAVSAPRSVKLDEHVLRLVVDNLVEVLCHKHLPTKTKTNRHKLNVLQMECDWFIKESDVSP